MKNNKKKKKEDEKNLDKQNHEHDIEIVYGSGSEFELDAEVGDYMNDLKPSTSQQNKKKIVIPKTKK